MLREFKDYVDGKGVYQGPAYWNGDIYNACSSRLVSLGTLRNVRGFLSLYKCRHLKGLGALEVVKGKLDLDYCTSLKDLGVLRSVGGSVDLRGCANLVGLGDLKYVAGNLLLLKCKCLANLGELLNVAGILALPNTKIMVGNRKLKFRWLSTGENTINQTYQEFTRNIREIESCRLTALASKLCAIDAVYRPFIAARLKEGK